MNNCKYVTSAFNHAFTKVIQVETLASVYSLRFSGDTTIKVIVTGNPEYIDECINDIRSKCTGNLVVGLRFKPGILQLSFGHECLIITGSVRQPLSPSLKNFLEEKGYTFVGVGINSLQENLFNYYGVRLRNAIDLGYLSSIKFDNNLLCGADLKILAESVVDKDINQPICGGSTNQGASLNEHEIALLCKDSYLLHEISSRLGFDSNPDHLINSFKFR